MTKKKTYFKNAWNPPISTKRWIKRNPDLADLLPMVCDCGKIIKPIPYLSRDWIGFEGACDCNPSNQQSVCIRMYWGSNDIFTKFFDLVRKN
jgi:hypothetical protein